MRGDKTDNKLSITKLEVLPLAAVAEVCALAPRYCRPTANADIQVLSAGIDSYERLSF